MASLMNDRLAMRTCLGTLNYYDNHEGLGTASQKCWAAMSGGHDYNPISHEPARFLGHLRSHSNADGTLLV